LLLSGLVAFAFFCAIGGQAHLFDWVDSYCTGHQMLLAQSYLHAGFATPLGLPTEDPFGPVGKEAPYTGQPPLFAMTLAGLLAVIGVDLAAARVFTCLISACSAVLVMWLAWRVTRQRWAALLSMVIFSGHFAITQFCSFVCNDTPGLTWSLLLISLYPWMISHTSRRALVLYCLLAALGGLISWHCYIVPVACALALAVTDRHLFRARWHRALGPVMVAFLVGLALIGASNYVTQHYDSNRFGCQGTAVMSDKFFSRTGLNNPGEAFKVVYRHIDSTVEASAFPLMGVFLVLAANYLLERRQSGCRPRAERRAAGAGSAEALYLHALWMFPAIWLLVMPQMHEHEYQMLFFAPFFAVFAALLIQRSLPPIRSRYLRAVYPAAILLGFVAIAAGSGRQAYRYRSDLAIYRQLEADIRALTSDQTVVVLADPNRGTWWRIQRPVIGLPRLRRAQGRDHVLVVPPETKDWENDYTILIGRHGFGKLRDQGYVILAPRHPTSAHGLRRRGVNLLVPALAPPSSESILNASSRGP
jgi:hypothetical protein